MQVMQEMSTICSLQDHRPGQIRGLNHLRQQDDMCSEEDIRAITCFTPGTGIATQAGLLPVEKLSVGDRILTRDHGYQPIRWIGKRQVSCARFPTTPNSLPVLIRADALGPGRPERDMIVSPRHRVLTTDRMHISMTGETEVLIEAGALVGQPGVMCVVPHHLTYVHVLFDQHEVILSDNLWSESFHLNRKAADALLHEQHTAIQDVFPELRTQSDASLQVLARTCLTRENVLAHCA
ncbi:MULTISPECIES: Hint domain-containing protein [unclassified Roseovarius]|uniref:Hint domain-containing protein n=1 Tax=unclassified Roseovarius TaxID=2614913 RepID=UPI00273E35BB|nr:MULTISPECIES: Hint domain-containing protein [unclassified Roseovarius]